MIAGTTTPLPALRAEGAMTRSTLAHPGDPPEEFAMLLEGFAAETGPAEDEAGEGGTDAPSLASGSGESVAETLSILFAPVLTETQDAAALAGSMLAMGNAPPPAAVRLKAFEKTLPEEMMTAERTIGESMAPTPRGTVAGEKPAVKVTGADVAGSAIEMPDWPAADGVGTRLPATSQEAQTEAPAAEREPAAALLLVPEDKITQNPSPAAQIMAVITATASQGTATATAVSGAQQTQFMGPPGPTPSDVKALRIKLHPEELGEVEVTIRRAGLQTKVTITVGSRAAADAIAMDKGLLEERLGSLLAPGNGHAVTFSMDIRDTGQGQAQAQGQGQESGARGFTEQALAGGQGSGRDGRPDRRHQTLNITGDEIENEERVVRLTSGSGRIV